jgi:hypothetical protein
MVNKMTNREWLEKMSNKQLAELFCYDIAQDGGYCVKCPFKENCTGNESGFENFLNKEYKNE